MASGPSRPRADKRVGAYLFAESVGTGSFASVFRALHEKTGRIVAIKMIAKERLSKKLKSNLSSEISILRKMQHEHIVALLDHMQTARHIYIVLEYCDGGDLAQLLRSRKHLTEEHTTELLRQLASGLCFMRRNNVVHRDLKPQNLLLKGRGERQILKIADFGFARHIQPDSLAETLCGSPLYMAPEILNYQKYDVKADLWSVGTIVYEMLYGKPPYTGANHMELLRNIQRHAVTFPSTPQVSEGMKELLRMLLKRDPAERCSYEQLFEHPVVNLGAAERLCNPASEEDLTLQFEEQRSQEHAPSAESEKPTANGPLGSILSKAAATEALHSAARAQGTQSPPGARTAWSPSQRSAHDGAVGAVAQEIRGAQPAPSPTDALRQEEMRAHSPGTGSPNSLRPAFVERVSPPSKEYAHSPTISPPHAISGSPQLGAIVSPRTKPFKPRTAGISPPSGSFADPARKAGSEGSVTGGGENVHEAVGKHHVELGGLGGAVVKMASHAASAAVAAVANIGAAAVARRGAARQRAVDMGLPHSLRSSSVHEMRTVDDYVIISTDSSVADMQHGSRPPASTLASMLAEASGRSRGRLVPEPQARLAGAEAAEFAMAECIMEIGRATIDYRMAEAIAQVARLRLGKDGAPLALALLCRSIEASQRALARAEAQQSGPGVAEIQARTKKLLTTSWKVADQLEEQLERYPSEMSMTAEDAMYDGALALAREAAALEGLRSEPRLCIDKYERAILLLWCLLTSNALEEDDRARVGHFVSMFARRADALREKAAVHRTISHQALHELISGGAHAMSSISSDQSFNGSIHRPLSLTKA